MPFWHSIWCYLFVGIAGIFHTHTLLYSTYFLFLLSLHDGGLTDVLSFGLLTFLFFIIGIGYICACGAWAHYDVIKAARIVCCRVVSDQLLNLRTYLVGLRSLSLRDLSFDYFRWRWRQLTLFEEIESHITRRDFGKTRTQTCFRTKKTWLTASWCRQNLPSKCSLSVVAGPVLTIHYCCLNFGAKILPFSLGPNLFYSWSS